MAKENLKNKFKIRNLIVKLKNEEILVIQDKKGRIYFWNGKQLFRGKPLKG